MAKQIIWTVKAKNELLEILEYWLNRNKSNAFSVKLNKLIQKKLALISEYPNIGRKTDVENVFVSIVHQYLVYYQTDEKNIYVLTIRHGHQNPETLKLK